jgi:hypothetical protein
MQLNVTNYKILLLDKHYASEHPLSLMTNGTNLPMPPPAVNLKHTKKIPSLEPPNPTKSNSKALVKVLDTARNCNNL